MNLRLTDDEIDALLREAKPLPGDFSRRFRPKEKGGHKEYEIGIEGANQSRFRLIYRQSLFNSLDFSVILGYIIPNTNQVFRLRRYNGKSHEHTNRLEQEKFYDFHIHTATERYQTAGWNEDGYAVPTDRYPDHHGALKSMFNDCGFEGSAVTTKDLTDWGI